MHKNEKSNVCKIKNHIDLYLPVKEKFNKKNIKLEALSESALAAV